MRIKVIGRPCPVCGRELSLAEYKTVEHAVKFLLDEDACCFKLIEEIARHEPKAPS